MNINSTFHLGNIYYVLFEITLLTTLILILLNREKVLKHYKVISAVFILLGLGTELNDYIKEIAASGNLERILPFGMCHLAVYTTTIIFFKYIRKLHIVSITLTAGAVLSIVMPAPLDGISMLTIRPYHFYFVHFYILIINILLAYKHNLIMTKKDYWFGISWTMLIATILIVISYLTNRDDLFFFSGPSGIFTENVEFGVFRAVTAYVIYFVLYSMPYIVYIGYKKLIQTINKKKH